MKQQYQHAVVYYEQPIPLWEQCVALINEHVREGWHWRYVADEHTCKRVSEVLSERTTAPATGLVLDAARLRFRESPIRVASIIAALRSEIEQVLAQGSTGVMFLIEMTWTIRTPSGAVYLREYEAALHEMLPQLPVHFVCLYNQSVLLDRQLLVGLHTHPYVHTLAGLCHNPFFVEPGIFAQGDERAQFRYWFKTIVPATTIDAPPVDIQAADLTRSAEDKGAYHLETLDPLVAEQSHQGRWKIRCFGQMRVYREDGTLVDWRIEKGATRKTKILFAYLLHRGAAGATGEELADLLWPDAHDAHQSLNRLYHVVNSLRRVLSPDLPAHRESAFVLYRDQCYFLAVPSNTWIDLPMFQELCYRGAALLKQAALDEALLCYQSAERLYTGDFLADIPSQYADSTGEDWYWGRRYWLRDMYLKLLYSIAGIYRQLQQVPDALHYCDRALRLDPSCEAAHREKLLALRDARRRDALDRQYKLYCETLLQRDLGPPSHDIQGLYRQLRTELST
ncbi:MAG: MEDS domain-containing protein [Ktedonobacteraceae bacterium]|nr:MEDS domain-containing protein [Ktedonobacteraceae bacterium]